MELSDEAELLALEKQSAEKLRTTVANKRGHYLKRHVSKRHYLLADALYENLSHALIQFPSLAQRVGVELKPESAEGNPVTLICQLDPDQKKKLLEALLAEAFASPRKP